MQSGRDRASHSSKDSKEALGLLSRILRLEAQRGYADDAVLGGLGKFLTAWLGRWPDDQREKASRLVAPLAEYAALAPSERQRAIEEVLRGASPGSPAPTAPAT